MTADNNNITTTAADAPTTPTPTHPPPPLTTSHDTQIPTRHYQNDVTQIRPDRPTPHHTMYLSNLDDQKFLRFSIKYIYLYRNSVPADSLRRSLSSVLSDYYPLAGRLRLASSTDNNELHERDHDDRKLVVDCNGEGALFAEAYMEDYTVDEFLKGSEKPEWWWRKLLIYRVEGARSILDVPPLVVQVTYLQCGGMILCTAINHCLCDGIGTSQFLNAWAYHTTTTHNHHSPSPSPSPPPLPPPPRPYHSRDLLKPRSPPPLYSSYPQLTIKPTTTPTIINHLQSFPLIPTSTTFTRHHTSLLKRHITPSLKCTSFESIAAHTWRSWVKSLIHTNFPFPIPTTVKLLFSVNIRPTLRTTTGSPLTNYYGNAFVLACAVTTVNDLITSNLNHAIKLIQGAKAAVRNDEEYVRGMVDVMEDKRVTTDLEMSLVISQWSRLGLEEIDFGYGKPVHMGPLCSDVYCLFLPVVNEGGDKDSVRVSMALPESVVSRFDKYMMEFHHDDECG